jgi:hypothetical protein
MKGLKKTYAFTIVAYHDLAYILAGLCSRIVEFTSNYIMYDLWIVF